MKSSEVEIEMLVIRETDAAILASDTGEKDDAVWLPKSQIDGNVEVGANCFFLVPQWLAIEKGLV